MTWLRIALMLGIVLAAVGPCLAQAPLPPFATPPGGNWSAVTSALGGQNWSQVLPPDSKPSRYSGLRLRCNLLAEPTAYGYQWLDFLIDSKNPVTADTQVTLSIVLRDWRNGRCTVEQTGEIVAGQSSTTITIRVPIVDQWNLAEITTWVDGVKEPLLTNTLNVGNTTSGQGGGLALLDATRPMAIPGFQGFIPQGPQSYSRIGDLQLNIIRRSPCEHWLDYTGYDIVRLAPQQLESLAQSQPAVLVALRQWIASGGTLWVDMVGRELEQLPRISELLQIAGDATAPTVSEHRSTLGRDGWQYANLAVQAASVSDLSTNIPLDQAAFNAATPSVPAVDAPPIPSRDWFCVRELGFGRVYAFPRSWNEVPSSLRGEQRREAAVLWTSRDWTTRHGIIPTAGNADFADWLIPGVGLAPVLLFQILITLFAIAIGPLNYWLLWRARRLHLLVLTVPLGALALTVFLLAYGTIADGFSTRVRARALTLLDQSQGEAVTHARLSYYASFTPREGLTFDDRTAIYPLLPGGDESFVVASRPQLTFGWQGTAQRLERGWLKSRTPTQYITQTVTSDAKTIDFRPQGEGELQAMNGLGSDIDLLIVHTSDDRWMVAESVATTEEVPLRPSTYDDAVRLFRPIMVDNAPRLPDELLGDTSNVYRDTSEFSSASSLLNQHWDRLSGAAGSPTLAIPPGSYLAIGKRSFFAPLGLDDVSEDGSIHVVLGTWRLP